MNKMVAAARKNRERLWKEIDEVLARAESKLPTPGGGR
jgi:hypothetical protein